MRKPHFISLIAIIGLLCISFRLNAQAITLENKANATTVKPSTIFTVRIPLQASTGFDWKLEKGSPLIYEVKSATEENIAGKMDGKTMKVFTLRSSGASGEAELKFTMSRSVQTKLPVEEKTLKVTIKP
ncbi:protease inhibitor I42 family protein [Solitalea koreensis]|uniref:Chagasin family peptidase inhibitor I42 n=1 Tax=Solitalea koreensis TaxID=543615 RepID=A0A521C387_9SPHI|nr:protease inhibitor I42 family protein [Solitalea koreensis]SMO53864.1 Chagasin family peptidase inhibitor I42 [Solitalea koreensis]